MAGNKGMFTKLWAYISFTLVIGVIIFLFVYVFVNGADAITIEFITQAPRGAILGMEGGIWPAIAGSFCFTTLAVILGGITAIASALYIVFY